MNPELTDKQQNTDICLIKNAYKLSLPLSRPLPVRGHLPRPLLLPFVKARRSRWPLWMVNPGSSFPSSSCSLCCYWFCIWFYVSIACYDYSYWYYWFAIKFALTFVNIRIIIININTITIPFFSIIPIQYMHIYACILLCLCWNIFTYKLCFLFILQMHIHHQSDFFS